MSQEFCADISNMNGSSLDAMIFAALILLQRFFQFPRGFENSGIVERYLRVVRRECGSDAVSRLRHEYAGVTYCVGCDLLQMFQSEVWSGNR